MVPDCSLTADCRFLKVHLAPEMRWVFSLSAYISRAKQSQVNTRRCVSLFISVTQSAASVPRRPVLSPSPCSYACVCACVNERMDGWAGSSSITAAAVYITTSASAGSPCEKPCARECRCLSQAGMGSATENGTCMRTVDGMRQTRGEPVPGFQSVYREKTSYMAFT